MQDEHDGVASTDATPRRKPSLLTRLLFGFVGFWLAVPIACLVAIVLMCGGTSWPYVLLTSIGIVGFSSLVVAWSPNIGGEVISFVSNATKGYLDFILDVLEGLLET